MVPREDTAEAMGETLDPVTKADAELIEAARADSGG
jgi:hypothetical protein